MQQIHHECSPPPRAPDSVDLGWGLSICVFTQCVGEADAGDPRTFSEIVL